MLCLMRPLIFSINPTILIVDMRSYVIYNIIHLFIIYPDHAQIRLLFQSCNMHLSIASWSWSLCPSFYSFSAFLASSFSSNDQMSYYSFIIPISSFHIKLKTCNSLLWFPSLGLSSLKYFFLQPTILKLHFYTFIHSNL